MTTDKFLGRGFLLAGGYNILGMLLFSRCFTNPDLARLDPLVFAWPGQVAIVLWGFAYAACARHWQQLPQLALVFFVEKMLYVGTWLLWLAQYGSTLPALFGHAPMSALFFAIYGAGDLAFGLMFLWAARLGWRTR